MKHMNTQMDLTSPVCLYLIQFEQRTHKIGHTEDLNSRQLRCTNM